MHKGEEGTGSMSVQLILGTAGSGKTRFCLQQIKEQLQQDPNGPPIIMLVPEQASFETEYALVTSLETGGMIRAQVLSFRRLAYRVIQETGGASLQPVDETGKKMLLYRIMQQMKPELKVLQAHVGKKGWMDKCCELFTELRRYEVSPTALKRAMMRMQEEGPEAADEKWHDLWQLYEAFVQQMAKGLLDAESLLDLTAAQLKRAASLQEAMVYIDGFHGFTPQELSIVGELMQHCRSVVITLCADRDYSEDDALDEMNLFYPTAYTLQQLRRIAEERQVEMEEVKVLPPNSASSQPAALLHLKQHYGTTNQIWPGDAGGIHIRAASSRRAEVEAAAAEILRLVREDGCRWNDILVMIRQPEAYADLIQTIFQAHDIPCFIDQKLPVDNHPMVEFIRSALEVARLNWRYDSVFRCVKTDFLLPLEPDQENKWRYEMDQLENYVLAFGIQGSRWHDQGKWQYRFQSLDRIDDDEESRSVQKHLDRMHRLRQIVVKPLRQFQERLLRAENVREQTEAIYALLESVQASKRLEAWSKQCAESGQPEQARQHVHVWNSIMQLFDQMVEVLGEETVSLNLFEGILETGLEHIRYGTVPPSLDQVIVGNIDRTRSANKKHCFIFGLNDGVLPAPFPEEGLLTEEERERLQQSGIQLAPGSRRRLLDEQFLIYTLLSLPHEGLWLSYSMADEEGRALLPSEIIRRLQQMYPDLGIEQYQAEPNAAQEAEEQLRYMQHPRPALSHLSVQLRNWLQGAPMHDLWRHAYNWLIDHEPWRSELKRIVTGLFHSNYEKPLKSGTSRKLYGDILQASVSRMETFVACPFAHFISYGLRLKERRIFRLEAPDIGQLFHASLNLISVKLQEQGRSWKGLTMQECSKMAEEAVRSFAPRLQGEILLSSKRYHYIAYKLKQIVSRTAYVLSKQAERGEFTPVGLELGFGRGETLPPLAFELENGLKMEVAGRIDRVDKAESEQGLLLRVIDYKSSQTSLHIADVFYGLSLQILAYLDVVVSNAERWLGEKAVPAGVLYFHIHHPLLASSNPLDKQKAEQEYFKQFKMRGWILSDAEVAQKMDTDLKGYSDIIPVGLSAKGEFYKNSSVYTESQWEAVQQHIRSIMKQIGVEIASGKVEASPYRLGNEMPCSYCSFKPICQFDPNDGDQNYRYLSKLSSDELWSRLHHS